MQNLAEEFGQFRPGPSREELNHILNLRAKAPYYALEDFIEIA